MTNSNCYKHSLYTGFYKICGNYITNNSNDEITTCKPKVKINTSHKYFQ